VTPILVCESVRAATLAGLVRARDEANLADLVEIRLDSVADPDPAGVLAGRRAPVVVTCRPRWEGGGFDGDEPTRERLLEGALRAGAEFVDVEWRAPWRPGFLTRWADRVVLSFHDFTGTPPDLVERGREMARAGAAVVKVAVTTPRLRDLEPLLALGRSLAGIPRAVVIGMGAAGLATRILPHRFGSAWTYGGHGVAPGQVPAPRLIGEFRVRSTSAATAIFGLVGRPVGHSLSPSMHNAALAASRIDGVYLPFEAADFDDFVWAADALGVVGASVTAPFKGEARRVAGRVDRLVDTLGVANTLRRESDGSWAARNTDVEGFLWPLRDRALAGVPVAVLGAGGAAAAVVAALASRGAEVTVYARRPGAAHLLAERFGAGAGVWPPEPGSWALLVNATPVGTWPDAEACPVDASLLHGGLVYDLVYNPARTALLSAAAGNGCATIGGLEMLAAQAARQFAWWTGETASLDVMRAAAERRLEQYRQAGPEGPH
jgi:3-dehydroquinate dehydratase/shikimate dehydrogenase